jgi:hypothetical protein
LSSFGQCFLSYHPIATIVIYLQIEIENFFGDRPGSLHSRFERSNFKKSLLDNGKKPVKSSSEEPDPAGKKAFFIQRAIASRVREFPTALLNAKHKCSQISN